MQFTLGLMVTLSLAATSAAEKLTAEKLAAAVNSDKLKETLTKLAKIADQNNGTRAFNTPGYKASVDLVLSYARDRFGDKFDTYLHPFNSASGKIFNISLKGQSNEDFFVRAPSLVPPTPPKGITGSLVNTPVDDEAGSGCLKKHWEGIDATGKIALIKRGVCTGQEKVEFAKSKGAVAVIIYNQTPGTNFSAFTLGSTSIGKVLPTGITSLETAQSWISKLASGQDIKVTLAINSTVGLYESWNVISQSKVGDPNKVIMLGAHLDSVPAGPGINDDGSGSAALLEILEAVAKYDSFTHAIRFAWWGDEEDGLIGSYDYVDKLNATKPEELDKIKYYFNYDMIGSPFPRYAVFGFDNSGPVPQAMQAYLKGLGKNSTYRELESDTPGGDSDYAPFFDYGIPIAMINTGAGGQYDPCYHEACDDINNINWDALTVNTKAAADALGALANSLEGIPGRVTRHFEKSLKRREEGGRGLKETKGLKGTKRRGLSLV